MRKTLVFVAAFALVLVAGAAVAFMGSGDDATHDETPAIEEPETTTTEFHDEEPLKEEPKDEEHDEEPPKEEHDEEPPKDEENHDEDVKDEPDTDAPDIVILHPEDGQHFEKKEVVFEGKAEPGSKVFAGDWEADTDEEGNWRIVLILTHDGANTATLTAVDEAGNKGTDSVKVYYDPPGEEEPKEEPKEVGISVHQKYGECGEAVPYEKFLVSGPAGTFFEIYNDWGYASKELPDDGEYWITIEFPDMPCGEHGIIVKVNGDFYEDYGYFHICEEEGGGEGDK